MTRDGVPDDYDRHNPEHRQIYKFVRTLFNAAQLTAECAIITLVYLERLLTYAELDIASCNWKRIVLGAILLASKVWDDQAVWNVDYCQILKDITVEDMNELERQFLEMLQFNINVPSSVYAKYYFDLRSLAEANDLSFPTEPLSKERAQKLEAMSRVMQDKFTAEAMKNGMKKWSSLDNIKDSAPRRSVAILSWFFTITMHKSLKSCHAKTARILNEHNEKVVSFLCILYFFLRKKSLISFSFLSSH